jgi:PAS domain S-box-containing protein
MNIKEPRFKLITISVLIALSVFCIIYFHIFLNVGTVFTQFFYIPIILGSLWWGKRGIIVAFFLAFLLILGHHFLRESVQSLNDYFRAVFFIVVSIVVALLKERDEKSRREISQYVLNLNISNEQLNLEINERARVEQISQALLNVTTESIFMLEPDGTVIAANEIGAWRIGKSKEELIGNCFYDYFTSDLANSRRMKIDEAVQKGKPVRFEDKRGEFIFDINVYPVFDDSGIIKSIAFFARDITPLVKLQEEIITISENERQLLGQDLHDDLGQLLTGTKYIVTGLKQKMIDKSYPEISDIEIISEHIGNAIERVRRLSKRLYPVSIGKNGLFLALEEMCHDVERIFNISCKMEIRGSAILEDIKISNHLYYITQESVNNALKHGNAKNISILLQMENPWIHLRIENDFGYKELPKKRSRGIGIEIMKYRANLINANLVIEKINSKFVVDLRVEVHQ